MKHRILIVVALCVTALSLMVGCSSSAAQQAADAQTQNRQYMSSVNSIMDTMDAQMGDFSTAVKDGEVLSLTSKLSAVDTCVDELKALTVPDAMKDIHSSYVTGAEELQTALSAYVQLYQDVKLGNAADYASRLADIQQHYDAGIAALQDADTKASQA